MKLNEVLDRLRASLQIQTGIEIEASVWATLIEGAVGDFEEDEESDEDVDTWDDYDADDESGRLADGTHFADPGGRSALRAATDDNPRNIKCGGCGRRNALTPADRARGYVCDSCADKAESGWQE